MHKSLVIRLHLHYTLYMFRTVLVHLQEQPFISCMSYLVYADTFCCCVLHVLLYQIAALQLYSFSFMFLYLLNLCACWADVSTYTK